MSYGLEYRYEKDTVAEERASFIRRTYSHLAGAILAFMALEAALLSIPGIEQTVFGLLGASPWSALFVLVAFMGVGIIAQKWAASSTSKGMQYAGLGLYIVLEALIMLPLLIIATKFSGDTTIVPTAGIMTLSVFAGLTLTVFVTGKDFSFLKPILTVCSCIALGVIIAAIIFGGFGLGQFFCMAMIALMAGYILYYTSEVMHRFPTDMHVAASLALFAAVATMFWYVLRLLLILADR